MNILMIINEQKDPEFKLANRVSFLIGNRAKIYLEDKLQCDKVNNASLLSEITYRELDFILVLGGDGTFLSVAKTAAVEEIPVVGINLGRLGFLTEIELDALEKGLNKLFDGDYVIEDRMMLQAKLKDGKQTTALNDVVVTRANSMLKILDMDIFIDGKFVDDFKADGIIIATPTGSTAYSLSAGGPIVDPSLNSMIVTPICPHKMYSRTIIVPPNKEIKVICKDSCETDAVVAADSAVLGTLTGDKTVTVSVATKKLKLIRFRDYNFFGILHDKLLKKEGE